MAIAASCSKAPVPTDADCIFEKGACVRKSIRYEVALKASPLPLKPMAEHKFEAVVTGRGWRPSAIILDLSMPGMKMPENKIKLAHKGGGVYEGKATLPKCPKSGRLWKALIVLSQDDSVEYLFNVEN